MSKYDVYSIESYEPGSNDLVLKNKLGIICPEEMKRVETQALERVYLDNSVWSTYNESHSFCIDDIYFLHNQWLEDIYFFGSEGANHTKGTLEGLSR